jgi:hypothetical protein
MKIEKSAIDMTSNHTYSQNTSSVERLRYWNDKEKVQVENRTGTNEIKKSMTDFVEISKEALNKQADLQLKDGEVSEIKKSEDDNSISVTLSEQDKLKIQLLEEFLSRLTGKKIKFKIMDKIRVDDSFNIDIEKLKELQNKRVNAQPIQRQGWGLDYNFQSTVQESEKMSFSSKGVVQTADGRNIKFSLDLKMSREFLSQTNVSVKAGDALIDPLVINYSGKELKLRDDKISFDIDLDGNKDKISFVTEGSGFLALDKNSDGVINDGKELFGPSSGDGFKELKNYDEDGNGWIDENDSIYEKLRIWTKDENGKDKLFALGQVGVGAIYLRNIDTEFSLNNNSNETLGKIRSSSVFLKEDGTAGIIQHIDLSV